MKVSVKQDANRLIISQANGLGTKLLGVVVFLAIFGILPGCAFYQSGTIGTLTCVQEARAGVVCTDRVTWFGAFPRTARYERVQLAYAKPVYRFRSRSEPGLSLKTANGVVVFRSLHDTEYVTFIDRINAFVRTPTPEPLVMRSPVHLVGLLLTSPIVFGLIYLCGIIVFAGLHRMSFDAQDRVVRLRIDGLKGRHTYYIPFDDIADISADDKSVYVSVRSSLNVSFKLFELNKADPDDPSPITADTVVQTIKGWLAQHRLHLRVPREVAAADLVEVSHPTLAYLLSHSPSAAVVMSGKRAYLNMDRIGGSPDQQRGLRDVLATLEQASPESRDDLARLIAPKLLAACQVDVPDAIQSANPPQRQAIDALLYPSRQPPDR